MQHTFFFFWFRDVARTVVGRRNEMEMLNQLPIFNIVAGAGYVWVVMEIRASSVVCRVAQEM